ncbi:MAG: amidase [Ignavibacteria bacterium]|nr:MAG: amidase [Ignavibacteria bacterium]KAF0161898.1 MAG: amidase [Ignavibacteria bacterium]
MKRHPQILKKEKTALLVIDIQERILPVIHEWETVVANTLKLINGFQIMNVPIFYTEQYPKGLGGTESRIKEALSEAKFYEKITFSCIGAGNLFDDLKSAGIVQVVVCGVESHVCVQQTVLDLLANGFQVNLAADAVSSRRKFDFETSLNRMHSNGAEVTVTESILFELLEVCGTVEFKSVSKLVK